jgi:hypothetical protein
MKFTAVAALAMAALVSAQSRSDIPACALPCLDDAVKSSTSCSTTDFTCICKKENFSKVQGAATGCVIEKCGSDVAISKLIQQLAIKYTKTNTTLQARSSPPLRSSALLLPPALALAPALLPLPLPLPPLPLPPLLRLLLLRPPLLPLLLSRLPPLPSSLLVPATELHLPPLPPSRLVLLALPPSVVLPCSPSLPWLCKKLQI